MKNNQNQYNKTYSIVSFNPDDIDSHKLKNKENKHFIKTKKADINILDVYTKKPFVTKSNAF